MTLIVSLSVHTQVAQPLDDIKKKLNKLDVSPTLMQTLQMVGRENEDIYLFLFIYVFIYF